MSFPYPSAVGSFSYSIEEKTVRDMQYRFESDSYDGADLTLLAKHITKKHNHRRYGLHARA